MRGRQLMGIGDAACTRSRRWYGPWRCAWCREALGIRQHLRKAHRQLPFQPAWLLRLLLSLAGPPPLAPPLRLRCLRLRHRLLPRSPSHPARWLHQMAIHVQSASHADGWPDGSRQTRKRPAKTSPRSEAGRHRSSRTAGIACRQPQDARSGRASSERRTRPIGYQGARQRRAVLLRTPYLAAGSRAEEPRPAPVPEPRRTARSARPSGQARSRASGITLVERRTSNPIASRAGTRLHSSVVIMRCFATAHDTHEGGPVPPQGPSLRQKNRSPQLFCKRLLRE